MPTRLPETDSHVVIDKLEVALHRLSLNSPVALEVELRKRIHFLCA